MSTLGLSSVAPPNGQTQSGARDDYRRMVDAIHTGDLDAARNAYGRVAGSDNRGAAGSAPAAIGAALSAGDLSAAAGALDGLQRKAVAVLRQAQVQSVSPTTPRSDRPRGNAPFRITV